jgi:N-methylhydantoinase A/oxoprolinase/acetone carboxylase beta subunit
MGSFPGPACYGLGGDSATLTDAFVIAGLVNPEYFLGGTKPIDRELARQSMERAVARPLGVQIEEACRRVIDKAFALVAGIIEAARGALHADFAENTLFAYGGNGGLFGCSVADKAGLRSVLFPALGPVFCAFGSSVSDILHLYERPLSGESGETDVLPQILQELMAEGEQDLLGEGIRPENLTYEIEFEASANGRGSQAIPCPERLVDNPGELRAHVGTALGVSGGADSIRLELLRLRVKKAMAKPRAVEARTESAGSEHALCGTRLVSWGSSNGTAKIYRWEALRPGNEVEGCALLEGANTTYFVPEGWRLVIDRFGNGSVSRDS